MTEHDTAAQIAAAADLVAQAQADITAHTPAPSPTPAGIAPAQTFADWDAGARQDLPTSSEPANAHDRLVRAYGSKGRHR